MHPAVFGTAGEWDKDSLDGHYRKIEGKRYKELYECDTSCPKYATEGFQLRALLPAEGNAFRPVATIPPATPELGLSIQYRADTLVESIRGSHIRGCVLTRAGPHLSARCTRRDTVPDAWAILIDSNVGRTHSFWSVECPVGQTLIRWLLEEPLTADAIVKRVMVNFFTAASWYEKRVAVCAAAYLNNERRVRVDMTCMAGPAAHEERVQRRVSGLEWASRGKFVSRELALARHGLNHMFACFTVTCHQHLPLRVESRPRPTLRQIFDHYRLVNDVHFRLCTWDLGRT